MRKWTDWLREDLGSRPYAWLRPDFVPWSPFLVVKDPLTEASRILVEPHLIDAEFRKAWMPFFCRSAILLLLLTSFWDLWVIFCFRSLSWIFLEELRGICRRLPWLKSLLQVGWMIGFGMRLRLFHSLGSPVWPPCWSWLSPPVVGLRVHWMLIFP